MTLLQTEEFREIPDELGKIISLHLNNKELEKRVIEEDEPMCKAIDDLIKDSKAEGRAEGRAEGCESTFRCMSELMDGKKKDSLIEEGFELDVVEKAWNMLKSRKVIL